MPCTILKSDWLCHHVLIVLVVLGANHVMCFLTSVCYFPWLVFRLHCITVHFIAFRLRSTLAFRLHCKTISGEVMLCCLLSSLGLQVFSTWILNCICVKFFRVFFSICVWNQSTIESDLMSCWWLHFYGLVALIGCRELWSVCCPETRGGVWSSA